MQGVPELSGGEIRLIDIVSIRFIDNNTVRHFHDTSLDTLQLISGTGQLNQQEEVHHRMYGRLALSDTHGLYEYGIETGGLA